MNETPAATSKGHAMTEVSLRIGRIQTDPS